MKISHCSGLLLLLQFSLLLLGALSLSSAQTTPPEESRPLPGTGTVFGPKEQDDPSLKEPSGPPAAEVNQQPTAYLRVWNTAKPKNEESFACGLLPADASSLEDGDFIWLFRGVSSFDFRDYQEIPPGRYTLLLLQETPMPTDGDLEELNKKLEDWFSRPRPERVLHRSPPFVLQKNQYLTLLLDRQGERWTHRELEEPADGQKRLRVFNLVGAPAQIGFEAPDGRVAPLWGGDAGTPEVISIPPQAGEVVVLVQFSNERGSTIKRRHETDFKTCPSATVVILTDRYGRTASRLLPNLPGTE